MYQRPDISNAVRWLSTFTSKYEEIHWKFLKKVLRYLKGTKKFGLCFTSGDNDVVVYADAAYACEEETGRSVTGIAIKQNGAPIVWKSKAQVTVAKSTMESEYMAMSDAVNELMPIIEIRKELNMELKLPVVMKCDNQAAIQVGNTEAPTKKSKHINVRYHNVREKVSEGYIHIEYVPTGEQEADGLTKMLGSEKLGTNRDALLGIKLGGVLNNEF